MNEMELRQEICRVGRSLFERGYVHSTAGNISVRLLEGFLITPSEACLGFLNPEVLAKVGADGVQLSGERASKTLMLHRRIYAADADAACVIHTHSTHLVALTLTGVWKQEDILPPITPYYVMKVGHVPLIEYYRPGDATVGDLVAHPRRHAGSARPQCVAQHARGRDGRAGRAGRNRAPLAACRPETGAAYTAADRSTAPAIWRFVVASFFRT
jgi:ribulose-5-phosphate 4-epimerase/fuculose-1-phosphate aldolase